MSIISEFKEFAIKGNAIDMAVGLVIGAAFGKIVSSFVADVIKQVRRQMDHAAALGVEWMLTFGVDKQSDYTTYCKAMADGAWCAGRAWAAPLRRALQALLQQALPQRARPQREFPPSAPR